jgi:hypothetical protein
MIPIVYNRYFLVEIFSFLIIREINLANNISVIKM